MTARQAQLLGAARQVALSVGAVVGAACILLTLAALIFDLRPLVFRSGSMAPTIDTGALAIAHGVDASTITVGQVVSVPTSSGERVTHRVVQVEVHGDKAVLRLRGDANKAPDASPYVVDHADKVLFSVPWLGYLLGWLTGPIGLFALGLYAAFLLSVILRPGGGGDADRAGPTERASGAGGRHAGPGSAGVLLALVVGLGAGGVAEGRVTPTLAAFTDGAGVSGATQTAYTVPAPDASSCAAGGDTTTRVMTFAWPANVSPLPPLSYNPGVTGLTTYSTAFNLVGTTQQMTVSYPAGNNTSTVVTVTATGYPTGASSWTGPTSTWKFKTGNNKNIAPTCGETVPPVHQVVAPDATTRTTAAEQTYLAGPSGCTAAGIIFCGTMSDVSTISSVQYILQRVASGTTRCWTGTWTTTCGTYQNATLNGQTQFYATGNTATVYGTAGSYTLTVRVTDLYNNVSSSSVSFTLT